MLSDYHDPMIQLYPDWICLGTRRSTIHIALCNPRDLCARNYALRSVGISKLLVFVHIYIYILISTGDITLGETKSRRRSRFVPLSAACSVSRESFNLSLMKQGKKKKEKETRSRSRIWTMWSHGIVENREKIPRGKSRVAWKEGNTGIN